MRVLLLGVLLVTTCVQGVRQVDDGSYTLVHFMHGTDCTGPHVCEKLKMDQCVPVGPTNEMSQLYAKMTNPDGNEQNMEITSCQKSDCDCDMPPHQIVLTPDSGHTYGQCQNTGHGYSLQLLYGPVDDCITERADVALGRWDVKMPVPKEKLDVEKELAKMQKEQKKKAMSAKYSFRMPR
eukprot:gnl/MRDRNA2_/MRDRNA2_110233_c0_seq1.p1 gnl/MRDRNA2_/MRDRNA2_110233_c0~~gnl/MRDRNA2_/MRDRNA2_110233_c0_seq1.p1  ORF type:complete len:180 (-),score=33.81 gnl/MRDRNA2_/MRDRNA2_110233_c0_seq1:4-543(-)